MKRYYSVKITIAALALSTALCGCSLFGGTSSSRTLSEVSLPTTEEMVLKYDGYGFQVLQTKAEQRLYAGIDAAVQKNVSEEFVTENLDDVSRVSDVIEFYKDDHPEVFWIDDTEPYYYSEEGELLNIMLNYRLSGDELTAAKQALEEKVEEAVNGAPETDDSYTLEMYAHDCVIAACEYDELSTKLHKIDKVRSNEQNVYGVFVEKKAVCEGYARAFQLLCDRLELPCWVIQGKAKSSDDDEAVFAAALRQKAVILTSDRDFYHTIPLLHPLHSGIVVVALSQPNRAAIQARLKWFMDNIKIPLDNHVFVLRDFSYRVK